jgi:hypothetical protein
VKCGVFFEVRTELFNIIYTGFGFRMLKFLLRNHFKWRTRLLTHKDKVIADFENKNRGYVIDPVQSPLNFIFLSIAFFFCLSSVPSILETNLLRILCIKDELLNWGDLDYDRNGTGG